MRKSLERFVAAIFLLAYFQVASLAAEISVKDLPELAKAFIASSYPNTEVVWAKEEPGWFFSDYSVKIADSTLICFDSAGNCKSLENAKSGIVLNVLPLPLKEAVETRFIGVKVRRVEFLPSGDFIADFLDGRKFRFNTDGGCVDYTGK